MKRITVVFLAALSLLLLSQPSVAAKDGDQGPSARAMERASENASFKREESGDTDEMDAMAESGDKMKKKKKKKQKGRDQNDTQDADDDKDADASDDTSSEGDDNQAGDDDSRKRKGSKAKVAEEVENSPGTREAVGESAAVKGKEVEKKQKKNTQSQKQADKEYWQNRPQD